MSLLSKVLIPITIYLLSFSTSFSQSKIVHIEGTVMDTQSGQPLEYATVIIRSLKEPVAVTGGITDINGQFNVEVSPGEYNVRVEFITYKPYIHSSQSFNASTNLGVIKMLPDVKQLEAVEIVGERTSVEVHLDKKIYNIGKDLTNSGATISDALDNIPSVTVDIDGAISLRGNGNVRILINGRPSALAGFGSTDALRQLSADAIEKVEVITSPSARYDAEGTAGILNIVLKKEKTRGFNGSVNTSVGLPSRFNFTPNLNFRTNKFNFFTTLGYSYSEPPGNGYFDNTYRQGGFDRIIEDRDISRLNRGFNGTVGIEYFLDETSSITANVFGRLNDGEDITQNNTVRFVGNQIDSRTLRREIELEEEETYQFALNYNNDFDDNGQKLSMDIQYSFDEEYKPIGITENNIFPNVASVAAENILEIERQNEFLIQADYVLPIGDAQFEAGYRGNFAQTDTDFSLEELDLNTELFESNEGLTNQFIFNQNVQALYTQFGNNFGKFNFLAGLRLEVTELIGEVIGVDISTFQGLLGEDVELNFNKSYVNLFPTINLTYEPKENENITFGYNRRINRARGWYINPFPSRSSRTNVFQGNPDLNPSFSDAFELGYLKRWDKLTLTSSIYYQRETEAFERVQEETGELTNDGIIIIRSIPINLATNERIGAELGLLYNPTDWWRINGSFNFFEFNTTGFFREIDFGAKNTSWFTRVGSKITLPGQIDWQANFFYTAPTQNAQTVNEGVFSINLALSKDILKDKATIAFSASDLLNSRKRFSITETPFFTSNSEFQWRERQIILSFVYRINQKKDNRGARKDYENEY